MSPSLTTSYTSTLPGLGRSLTAFKERILGPVPTNEQYHDSFAEQLSDLDGRCRWALAGKALVIWEGEDTRDGLRHRIDELVAEYEAEIYKGRSIRCDATTRHCWMLGSDKAFAQPTVVISHNDEIILKRTMRVIRRPKTLESKGFKLKGCPNCDLVLLTKESMVSLFHHADEARQGLPISLCGAELVVRDPVRSATLGGVLILDGAYYGVTVAHAFTEPQQASTDKLDSNAVLYDSDWAESSSGDGRLGRGNESIRFSPASPISSTHKKTSSPVVARATSRAPLIPQNMGDFSVAFISSQNPLRDEDDGIYDDVDWALIEVSNPMYHGMNRVVTNEKEESWLASSSFRSSPPRGPILTVTCKGTVRGLGTGTTCSIKLLGSSRTRIMWSIQMKRRLDSGDSGSWVFDAATGEIYGVLIAGSAMLQEGYVIPIRDVFNDIQRSTKACELRVPTTNDALCLASRFGNVNLVKSLLAAGVDINESLGSTEYSTALLEAAEHEQLEVMDILLSRGAKFDEQGGQQHGRTAVLAATRSGDLSLVEALISAGAHQVDKGVRKPQKPVLSQLKKRVQRQGQQDASPLDWWLRTPENHELIALGIDSRRLKHVARGR